MPRWPEIQGGGASFWKRDPVGTFGRYFKSRYDMLKYCVFVIYERLPSRNNRLKSLLYHKMGVHCIPNNPLSIKLNGCSTRYHPPPIKCLVIS